MTSGLKVFMVAGEASADSHGAALLAELKRLHPGLTCFGVGDRALEREGMEIVVDSKAINAVGILDWTDRLKTVIAAYRTAVTAIESRRPDCAILLDLPDFNLRLAGRLKALGIPVVYYISPQVWAWRKYRIRKIRRVVDRMLVVFPFEKEFYDRKNVPVEFVGHPLIETIRARPAYRTQAEISQAPRLALLPGSRLTELKYHAPVFRGAIELLKARYPRLEIKVPVATTLGAEAVRAAFPDPGVELETGSAHAVLEWADAAVVASGTATLETALIGTPFALIYIMSPSSGWLAKHFFRYKNFFGMPNLLQGREAVREFLQEKATPEAIAAECAKLIDDPVYREGVVTALKGCREKLGSAGASARAARQVLDVLGRGRKDDSGLGFAVPEFS